MTRDLLTLSCAGAALLAEALVDETGTSAGISTKSSLALPLNACSISLPMREPMDL